MSAWMQTYVDKIVDARGVIVMVESQIEGQQIEERLKKTIRSLKLKNTF